MKQITGGYILKARSIQQSEISKCSPCVREVWDWLLMNATHKQKQHNGFIVERGQLFCSYSDIRNGLAWYIGWRKMTYSERSTKDAMKRLRKRTMICTTKRPRGMLVTICNYNAFQTPENYEAYHEAYHDRYQEGSNSDLSINKNGLNNKEEKNNIYTPEFEEFWFNYPSRGNHTNNKAEAFSQWQARLKQKHEGKPITSEQMITGGINYKQHCVAADKIDTKFVMQASRFLGNKKHFMDYQKLKEVKQNARSHKTASDVIDEAGDELKKRFNLD